MNIGTYLFDEALIEFNGFGTRRSIRLLHMSQLAREIQVYEDRMLKCEPIIAWNKIKLICENFWQTIRLPAICIKRLWVVMYEGDAKVAKHRDG